MSEKKRSLEHRLAISRGKLATHKKSGPKPIPEKKTCITCNKEKVTRERFALKKYWRTLADGTRKLYLYYASECTECSIERNRKWKEEKRKTGELAQRERKYHRNRDRIHTLQQRRAHYAKLRAQQGLPYNPRPHLWTECDLPNKFDAEKFASFISRFTRMVDVHGDSGQIQSAMFINGYRITESHLRALNRWRKGQAKYIKLETADDWAVCYDLPLWEIEEEAGKLAA